MNEEKKTFRKWMLTHILSNQWIMLVVIASSVLVIVARSLFPILLGIAVDRAIIDSENVFTQSAQLDILVSIVVVILFIAVFRMFMGYARSLAQEVFSWRTQRNIREELFDLIQNKPLKYHDSVSSGEIMALATNDLGQVGGFLSFGFGIITEVIITLFITAGMVLSVLGSIELVIASIPFLIAYIWALRHYNRRIGPISHTFMRKWSGIATAIQDNITGAEVVRAFGSEEYERKKFMDYVVDFRDTWEKQQIIQARYFPTLFLYSAMGFTFILASFLILNGRLTIGGLIAFTGLLANLLPTTYVISWGIQVFNAGMAGAKRIHIAMYSQKGEKEGEKGMIDFSTVDKGSIRFNNVTFSYPQSKKPVLEDINLEIDPFQTVAIVGPTGSGKSSLVKLLLRLYDYEGEIYINGHNIQDFTLESLRKGIGLIEQDVYLFPRTIRENIAYGKREATQEEIEKAAKLARIHNFIMESPDKYETKTGEGGSQLSGGQKQRVAIARTFITDPRILILDDSTSSVDSRTEEEIVQAIESVASKRTTFIITHRLSLIRKADKVVVIKNGRILEVGHHSDLIRFSLDYRRIFGKDADLPPLVPKHQVKKAKMVLTGESS
ncbi:MAG: ABC transporter ATP-binding protein [Candidatus Hodarchaeales archaeon]